MGSTATRKRIDPRRLEVKCETHKIGYATRDAALDACEGQMTRGSVEPGCHIEPYRCDSCGDWHTRNRRITFPRD